MAAIILVHVCLITGWPGKSPNLILINFRNLHLGLQVCKDACPASSLCHITPRPLHPCPLKTQSCFPLRLLYGTSGVPAKLDCLLFLRSSSLFLLSTYMLITLCCWKVSLSISTWLESSMPFKVELKCHFLFEDRTPFLKGCWTELLQWVPMTAQTDFMSVGM